MNNVIHPFSCLFTHMYNKKKILSFSTQLLLGEASSMALSSTSGARRQKKIIKIKKTGWPNAARGVRHEILVVRRCKVCGTLYRASVDHDVPRAKETELFGVQRRWPPGDVAVSSITRIFVLGYLSLAILT